MTDLLIKWLPLLIVFIVFIVALYFSSRRQMRTYDRHMQKVEAINDQVIAINKEVLVELREIKEILKDRA